MGTKYNFADKNNLSYMWGKMKEYVSALTKNKSDELQKEIDKKVNKDDVPDFSECATIDNINSIVENRIEDIVNAWPEDGKCTAGKFYLNDGHVYKCKLNTDGSVSPTNGTYFDKVILSDEITRQNSGLNDIVDKIGNFKSIRLYKDIANFGTIEDVAKLGNFVGTILLNTPVNLGTISGQKYLHVFQTGFYTETKAVYTVQILFNSNGTKMWVRACGGDTNYWSVKEIY